MSAPRTYRANGSGCAAGCRVRNSVLGAGTAGVIGVVTFIINILANYLAAAMAPDTNTGYLPGAFDLICWFNGFVIIKIYAFMILGLFDRFVFVFIKIRIFFAVSC